MISFKRVAVAAIGVVLCSGSANADVIYNLTLSPTILGSVGGTGTFTISGTPCTTLNCVSNYYKVPKNGSGTLEGLTIKLGVDTFLLANDTHANDDPLVQFTSGVLDDITYSAQLADGDFLQITNDYVYFTPSSQQETIGTFTAVLDPPASAPEPVSLSLMAAGLAGLGFARRRSSPRAS